MAMVLSNEQRAAEEVSTELTLFTNPWVIEKELTTSDIGHHCRLLLRCEPTEAHIIRYLSEEDKNMIQKGKGIKVNVYDHDTHSTFELVLKRWIKWDSYVLNNGWRKDFVERKDLKRGDTIGLFWDRYAPKLHFRVLSRAAPM